MMVMVTRWGSGWPSIPRFPWFGLSKQLGHTYQWHEAPALLAVPLPDAPVSGGGSTMRGQAAGDEAHGSDNAEPENAALHAPAHGFDPARYSIMAPKRAGEKLRNNACRKGRAVDFANAVR